MLLTSLSVKIETLGWREISETFGVVIHAAQSKVGKTLLSKIIFPPTDKSFSTNNTLYPVLAKFKADSIPAIPPPITKASKSFF